MLVSSTAGNKVGWETFDNLAEAEARAETARARAAEKAEQGYDFGYQVPGEIWRDRDGNWRVTIP